MSSFRKNYKQRRSASGFLPYSIVTAQLTVLMAVPLLVGSCFRTAADKMEAQSETLLEQRKTVALDIISGNAAGIIPCTRSFSDGERLIIYRKQDIDRKDGIGPSTNDIVDILTRCDPKLSQLPSGHTPR
jgi:hypothetical protein